MTLPYRFAAGVMGVALFALSACSDGPTEAEAMAAARQAAAARDFARAHVQIQNALQKNGYSSEARLLLAKILIEVDQPALALVELRKALDLGQSESDVLPLIAKVMLKQNQEREVISEFASKTLASPEADAELKTTLASAYFSTGKPAQAVQLIDAVLAARPEHAAAIQFKAQMKADGGDVDGALALLDGLLQRDPANADAWRARGDMLLYGKNDGAAAVASYGKALDARPGDVLASKAIIFLHIAQGNQAEAERRLKALKQVAPNDVQTKYFDAQLLFMRGEQAKAKEMMGPLLKAAPDNPWVLVLSGAIEMSMQSWSQAEAHLGKALRVNAAQPNARLLLARTQIQMGDQSRAIGTLDPLLLASAKPGPDVLALAGEAYLMGGDPKRASQMYEAAAKLQPKSAGLQLGRARALLAQGQSDLAMSEFVRIAAEDKGNAADLALISLHLRRNEVPAAQAAMQALVKKRPNDVAGHRLLAELALRQGRTAEARAGFERCLQIDPNYFSAVAGLAALDQNQGQAAQARKRFEELLKRQPGLLQPQLALARLNALDGTPRESVVEQFQAAVAAHADDARAHTALIDYLLSIGEVKRALSAANQADRTVQNNSDLMVLLGRAQEASNEPLQALATYSKVTSVRPEHVPALLQTGELQLKLKDANAAATTFRRVLKLQPDAVRALSGLVRAEQAAGRSDSALAMARELANGRKASPLGLLLEGDIHMARERPDAAAAAYAAALKRPESAASLVMYVHGVLTKAGRAERAEALAADWLAEHPKDVAFLVSWSHAAMAAGDKPVAEKRLRRALEIAPDQVAALNDLAWLLASDKRPGGVALAERALAANPDSPEVLDTLALALVVEGQLDRAAQVQLQAVQKSGQVASSYNLALARIYLAQGKKDLALGELKKLVGLGNRFPQAAEVAKLVEAASN